MRILNDDTRALIIDIQERLYPAMSEKEILLKNVEILIKGLKTLEVPVSTTEQYPKGLGHTIEELKSALDDCNNFEKSSFSCCDEAYIDDDLKRMNKKFVVIAGVEAHICVMQTVHDILDRGYIPVVVEDCIASRKENDKNMAVERMRQAGAVITTCESILFELCRSSKTSAFKIISNLVK